MIVLSSNKMMNVNHGNSSLHYGRISPKTFTIKLMKDQPFPLAEKKEFRISQRLRYHAVTQLLNYNEENVL